ncbi:hypothetical protein CBL_05984 [Carabus blaptoides fortunei]
MEGPQCGVSDVPVVVLCSREIDDGLFAILRAGTARTMARALLGSFTKDRATVAHVSATAAVALARTKPAAININSGSLPEFAWQTATGEASGFASAADCTVVYLQLLRTIDVHLII